MTRAQFTLLRPGRPHSNIRVQWRSFAIYPGSQAKPSGLVRVVRKFRGSLVFQYWRGFETVFRVSVVSNSAFSLCRGGNFNTLIQ
jgi:hypothetical protein